jgi:Glycosyl hydrolase family 67 N-terminus
LNKSLHVNQKELIILFVLSVTFLGWLAVSPPVATAQSIQRISLNEAVILLDSAEPSYVQYGARDLGTYLTEITGKAVALSTSTTPPQKTKLVIAVGKKMALEMGADLGPAKDLGIDGFVIRAIEKAGTRIVVVAGQDAHGTNTGIATLMQMIRADGKSPYLEGPLDLRSKPAIAMRGIHLNGWPLNYPYAFRSWKEQDWKRFIDIAWAQRINLFFLWPFMEVMPVPLSTEDEAYLQEVRRVVDYAQNQRGMEVWIMQSANRIAVSDCGTHDPRYRAYWVNDCQKDMNPADPQQFERIRKSFEAFYKNVNNADAFVMIDSDPGGWPQSPVSDQLRIFQMARKLLDKYSVHASETKLIDWMHVGWGRHKFFTSTDAVVGAYDWTSKNPDESDVAFMDETIRSFKANLTEPWALIAGQWSYLEDVKKESVLNKTVYLQYGAIESEPAFPATNLGQEAVQKVFDRAAKYPDLRGVMGNNQLVLLQFPRTFYFFATAWDTEYEKHPEAAVMRDLSAQLYPEHADLIADSFLALRETDPERIRAVIDPLEKLVREGSAGRPGALGRYLFPNSMVIARSLELQLEIRLARQSLLKALHGKSNVNECSKLVEAYFDKLLAWNKETGWDKMIDITVWPRPIYEDGKDLNEAMSRLKQILGEGAPYTSYAQVDAFFSRIDKNLVPKYGQDPVMIGCSEPLKMAVIRGQ